MPARTPRTSAKPAESELAICSSAGSMVPSICSETSGLRVSTTVWTDLSAWPNTPSNETSARAAGKTASTA